MIGLLSKILNIGIDNNTPPLEQKFIHIVNTLALVFFVSMFLNIPLNYQFLPQSLPILILICFNGSLAFFTFVFQYFKKQNWALAYIFSLASIHLAIVGALLGLEHHLHYYLVIVLFILFLSVKPDSHSGKNSKKLLIGLTLEIVCCFFFVIFWNRLYSPILNLPSAYNQIAGLSNLIFILGTCIINALYIRNSYHKAETNLTLAREKSETLLLHILPHSIAERLKNNAGLIADRFEHASVLFADLVNFKSQTAQMDENKSVEFLNSVFETIDGIAEKYGLEKIKTIGNSYMMVGGVPDNNPDHLEKMAFAALAIRAQFRKSHPDFEIRIGIDVGPLVAGVIGRNKYTYDLWGDCVNTASRMETHGIIGEIQVTDRVKDSLTNHFNFIERGEVEIKGKGIMRVWLLQSFG